VVKVRSGEGRNTGKSHYPSLGLSGHRLESSQNKIINESVTQEVQDPKGTKLMTKYSTKNKESPTYIMSPSIFSQTSPSGLIAASYTLVSRLAYYSTLKIGRYVPPKRQLTFTGLHGIIYRKREDYQICRFFIILKQSLHEVTAEL
jgi:hypothetical protein